LSFELRASFTIWRNYQEVSFRANKRVGIIASGNLAHTLTEDSPAGFNEAGKKFDNQIIDSLKTSKINSLLALPAEVVGAAVTCGFRPLLILLGIIREMNFTTEILSYETATGIGLLTANFKL
jgi:aromatic ring-opening dioxygenase LigB subunit